MTMKKIVLLGKPKRKLSTLVSLFSDLGFSKVNLEKEKLTLTRSLGSMVDGKYENDYKIVFDKKGLVFYYSIFSKNQERSRTMDSLNILLNILLLSNSYYSFDYSPLFLVVLNLISDIKKIMSKGDIDFTKKIDELEDKNVQLMKKYEDLVSSSEENARLLIEAERRSNELTKRVSILEGMSDKSLIEILFKWIKLHDGELDVSEFSESYKIPHSRVEDGINYLIREGYIRKKTFKIIKK